MPKENLKLVIVGHVDHGKSTLIGRLFYDTDSLPEGKIKEIEEICQSLGKEVEFGFIMDHLKEERDQGITIDTAQTFFTTEKRDYTIIDAPGHVEFVKNMITGASQAEAAILIIDVSEGVQEQTRRHAYILSLLGLDQVMVAMNKMDLINYSKEKYQEIKQKLSKFLDQIKIKPRYFIPISAKQGDNIAEKSKSLSWYSGPTLLEALDSFEIKQSQDKKALRFPIQDVYNFEKRVIVGRVESGVMKKGDEIKILPSQETTKIKSIEEYQKEVNQARAGKSTGITLEDKLFVDRGDVIVREQEKQPRITDVFKGHIFWMDKKPLDKNERLTFKCATQEVICGIEKIEKVIDSSTLKMISQDADQVKNREVADVIIRTEKPVILDDFNYVPSMGRFVLQRTDTCAGGIVTNIKK